MSIISKWNKSFTRTASRFSRDERGNFAIMFAVVGVALTLASGMAVDSARLFSAKSKLDGAVDAAILATTRDLTSGVISAADAKTAVGDFLLANVEANGVGGPSVTIDNVFVDPISKIVKVDAHLMLPMTLTAVAGFNEVKVASTSSAEYSDDRVEIAMALDVTGSMGGSIAGASSKMAALKTAANAGIAQLLNTPGAIARTRIGLVPYSASVNVTPILSKISTFGPTSKGCVAEREEADNKRFTDDPATAGHPLFGVNYPTSDNRCPSNQIVPLTNVKATLNSTIASLSTGGTTAGHVGIAWAQYMLSEKWNSVFTGPAAAAPATDPKVKKFAIIMTDGEFNTFLSSGQNNTPTGKIKSREYALGLCNQMKSGTVKVFTINFAGGPQAEQLMKNCASPNTASNQYFFNAGDAVELENAFKAIAKSINSLRLIG